MSRPRGRIVLHALSWLLLSKSPGRAHRPQRVQLSKHSAGVLGRQTAKPAVFRHFFHQKQALLVEWNVTEEAQPPQWEARLQCPTDSEPPGSSAPVPHRQRAPGLGTAQCHWLSWSPCHMLCSYCRGSHLAATWSFLTLRKLRESH